VVGGTKIEISVNKTISRKPPSFDDGFPLWMWGVKEKDMACGFRHYINSFRRIYQKINSEKIEYHPPLPRSPLLFAKAKKRDNIRITFTHWRLATGICYIACVVTATILASSGFEILITYSKYSSVSLLAVSASIPAFLIISTA